MAGPDPTTIPEGKIRLSWADYVELPNDGRRYQILDGELDVTPAPTPRHQAISKRLVSLLLGLERQGQGVVYYAPIDVVLDDHNVVQPDVIFVRNDRRAIVGSANVRGAPDLAVEILSPTSRRTDCVLKAGIYARFGVPSYWIADPELERLELFRLEAGAYRLAAAATRPGVLTPAELPGLTIDLDEVFS